jgi:hypothetical protein
MMTDHTSVPSRSIDDFVEDVCRAISKPCSLDNAIDFMEGLIAQLEGVLEGLREDKRREGAR